MSIRVPKYDSGAELVVNVRYGLGNRLCGLLCAWVAADIEQVPVRFIWRSSEGEGLPCTFGDLFDLGHAPALNIGEALGEDTGNWPYAPSLPVGFGDVIKSGRSLYITAQTFISYAGVPESQFFDGIRERFARLRLCAGVAGKLNIPTERFIAIHVRFSDHFPCYATTPRWTYRLALQDILRKTELPLWICGDAPGFIQELARMAPDRIYLSNSLSGGQTPDRNTRGGIETALADILTLSRALIVVGAPQSTFSQFGSSLGGGRMFRLVVHPLMMKGRSAKILWLIYKLRMPERRVGGIVDRFLRSIARCFANCIVILIGGRVYQDVSWIGQKKKFTRRLVSYLDNSLYSA